MYRPDDMSAAPAAAAALSLPRRDLVGTARDCRGVGARFRSNWQTAAAAAGREGGRGEGECEGEGRRAFMGVRVHPRGSSGRRGNKRSEAK